MLEARTLHAYQIFYIELTSVAEHAWIAFAELGGEGFHHPVNFLRFSW